MKFAFLLFLLLPIAGQTYVAWRTWQLLPDIMPLRMTVVGLMALAFVTFVTFLLRPNTALDYQTFHAEPQSLLSRRTPI